MNGLLNGRVSEANGGTHSYFRALAPVRVQPTNEAEDVNILDDTENDSRHLELETIDIGGFTIPATDALASSSKSPSQTSAESFDYETIVSSEGIGSDDSPISDLSPPSPPPPQPSKPTSFGAGLPCPMCVFYTHNLSKIQEKMKKINEILEREGRRFLDSELIQKLEKSLENLEIEVKTLKQQFGENCLH